MPVLFALTLGLGAALLFSAQPMIAKAVLPLLGGAPAVWNTCMVFFQTALLAGYAYVHFTTSRLGVRRQVALHAVVLLLPCAALPLGIGAEATRSLSLATSPSRGLLVFLLATVGLPFFAVATTAPLLQRWYAGTGRPGAGDPYFLYGASNVGSLAALLSYPLLIEPNMPLARQATLWSEGYGLVAVLILICAAAVVQTPALEPDIPPKRDKLAAGLAMRWVALAFIPSSLLLGVTTYLSTDIAPVPLLWVIPFALYLVTFIVVFARNPLVPHTWMVRSLPALAMMLTLVLGLGLVQPFLIPLHLLTFFVAATFCHGELARSRPAPGLLTALYLALAVGGALGGIFNALIAPAIFDRLAEYPLALVLACLALPSTTPGPRSPAKRAQDLVIPTIIFLVIAAEVLDLGGAADSALRVFGTMLASGLLVYVAWRQRTHPARFALGIGAALLASGLSTGKNGRALDQERNFFGVLQVTEDTASRSHRLFHGRTLHGQQSLDPARRREPLTYFARSGPIGQVFATFHNRPKGSGIAVAGLGAGSLACYAEPGERWTFYELDPAVARVARDPAYFTYLEDCRAQAVAIVLGDARIRLAGASPHAFGLIVLDAFSADAVPIHLLTREALRLYRGKLTPGGMLAFHITNRYLDLDPVLGALARDAAMACRVRYDLKLTPDERRAGKQRSIWAVLADTDRDLGSLATDPSWQMPKHDAGAVWTDDFSNLAGRLILKPR